MNTKIPARRERFSDIAKCFSLVEAGLLTAESAKMQLDYNHSFLYQSEVEKFFDKNPAIDRAKLEEFLSATEIVRAKTAGSGGGNKVRGLDNEEAALSKGVIPEKVEEYLNAATAIYAQIKVINELIDAEHRVSFSIPRSRKTESKDTEQPTANESSGDEPVGFSS